MLNDCEPPETCARASVRPCVGRTEPVDSGIQSIWFLKTAVFAVRVSSGANRGGGVEGGTYEVAVLLGRDPDVPVAPGAELPEFLDFGVVLLRVVFYGEVSGVEDADVAA